MRGHATDTGLGISDSVAEEREASSLVEILLNAGKLTARWDGASAGRAIFAVYTPTSGVLCHSTSENDQVLDELDDGLDVGTSRSRVASSRKQLPMFGR